MCDWMGYDNDDYDDGFDNRHHERGGHTVYPPRPDERNGLLPDDDDLAWGFGLDDPEYW